MVNWRTTTSAIMAFLGILIPQIALMFDDDPNTVTNWNLIIHSVGALLSALGILSLGINSRDRRVSDEQSAAGIDPDVSED